MIVRGSWPYGGEGSRREPRLSFPSVVLAVAAVWGAVTVVVLVVLAIRLLV